MVEIICKDTIIPTIGYVLKLRRAQFDCELARPNGGGAKSDLPESPRVIRQGKLILIRYRCLQVSENSGLGNTSKIDLTVIWRGTIINVFKLVHAL